jgi:hypothetical protein
MAVLHRVCHDRHRPLWEVNAQLPDELIDVIDRLLEKKPSRRYAAASDVEQALARVLSQVQQPRRWRAGPWLRRLRRQRKRIAAAVSAALAVVLLGWCASQIDLGGQADNNGEAIAASKGESALALTTTPDAAAPTASPAVDKPAVDKSVHELRHQHADFVRELSAIDQSLRGLSARPHPETTVLQGDPWLKELGAANRDVTRWERSWSVGPNGNSPNSNLFDNSKGENP